MAREKSYERIDPVYFTADGQENGIITVESVDCFKVKMIVQIYAKGVNPTDGSRFMVKRVLNETQMIIGPSDQTALHLKTDMRAYTVANEAFVEFAPTDRPHIPMEDYERAVYEEEPTMAKRSFLVDKQGGGYTVKNPFPVKMSDGDVNIGTVNAEIEVQLSRQDNNPDAGDVHDSVRLGNQDYELSYTANDDESKAAADVMVLNKLIDIPHDDIEITAFTADGDPETIEFREGGNLKLTLNLTYNLDGELQRVQRVRA